MESLHSRGVAVIGDGILNRVKNSARPWIDLQKFSRLNRGEKGVVFYSESKGMGRHLHPLVDLLCNLQGMEVSYVTSDASDSMFRDPPPGVRPVFVGNRNAAAVFFRTLDAPLVVTTTPDLGYRAYQRSKYDAHYVYVHHSVLSSHMVYKAGAFDQFDTIFCAGNHHVAETRRWEAFANVPEKKLIEFGHPRIDDLIRQKKQTLKSDAPQLQTVLIAPTWGQAGMLETVGLDLIRSVLNTGRKTVLRPHPETVIRNPKLVPALARAFAQESNFVLAPDVSLDEDFLQSAVMLSDWSGAAFEYALGLGKPVLFIDIPKKVLNPDYDKLGLEPVEQRFRNRLGAILAPTAIADLPLKLDELIASKTDSDLDFVRDELIFNVGESAKVGARELGKLWERLV